MKTCNKCGVEKPYSEFNKEKKNKDGYSGKCRECRKKENSPQRQPFGFEIPLWSPPGVNK